jgi:hypothetical protein
MQLANTLKVIRIEWKRLLTPVVGLVSLLILCFVCAFAATLRPS